MTPKTDPSVIVAEGYYRLKAENERLRGWLQHLNETAARNGWHIYSVSTSAALRGEMPPANPDAHEPKN
jgi:hypothetical protein